MGIVPSTGFVNRWRAMEGSELFIGAHHSSRAGASLPVETIFVSVLPISDK